MSPLRDTDSVRYKLGSGLGNVLLLTITIKEVITESNNFVFIYKSVFLKLNVKPRQVLVDDTRLLRIVNF